MRSYLDGGLTVEVLGADTGTRLFRGTDVRGEVAWLARGEPYDSLHAITFSGPGMRRGFHLHAGHRERLYVASGTLRLIAGRGGETVELMLEAGTLAAFEPGVAHGFIAETPVFAVSFGSGTDPITDTIPCPDLGS